MTNHPTRPYHQEASQSERQRILQNDRRANTFAGRTSSDLDLENIGRHAKLNTVIGLDAIEYPRLPTSSPFANDPVPPEEPLGYDINEAPIVGEEFVSRNASQSDHQSRI